MPRLPFAVLFALAASLAACGDAVAPAGRPQPAAAGASAGAMEFRGERPCVDCLAIEAWLRLEQRGEARSYRLVEHYRGHHREQRFEDVGEWTSEGALLRLRSQSGGERVYAYADDGSLQARDSHGRPLPAAGDEVLLPVAFDTLP